MTCSYPILYDNPIYAEAFQYSNSDDLPATVTLPLNWTCSPSGSFTTAYKNVLLCQSAGELIFADDLDSLQLRNDISHANYAIFWKTVGRVGTKFSIRTRRLNSSNYISFKVDFTNNNIELLSTINGLDTSIDYSSYDFNEENNKVYDFSIWTLNSNIYAFINGSNVLSGTSSLLTNKHGMSLYVPSINSSDPLAFSHMVVYETRVTPEQSLNADDLLVQFRLMLKEQIECPTDRTWRTYRNARLAWEKYKDYGYPDEVWTNLGYPIKEPSSEYWFEIVDFIGLTPYITDQPDSSSGNTGDTITLSVSATGSGTLSYQWRKNGVDISGAVSSTYTISSATSSDNGSYDVVVTNSFGSVNSDTVVVTVSGIGDLSSLIFYTIYAA